MLQASFSKRLILHSGFSLTGKRNPPKIILRRSRLALHGADLVTFRPHGTCSKVIEFRPSEIQNIKTWHRILFIMTWKRLPENHLIQVHSPPPRTEFRIAPTVSLGAGWMEELTFYRKHDTRFIGKSLFIRIAYFNRDTENVWKCFEVLPAFH